MYRRVWKERETSASSGRKKEQIEPASLNGRSKERAAVSASLNGTALKKSATSNGRDKSKERVANGTALKKSATSKGRNINSTVARSATTNSTVHQSWLSPYRTSNNQNETVQLPQRRENDTAAPLRG